jgi:hypothetical protein
VTASRVTAVNLKTSVELKLPAPIIGASVVVPASISVPVVVTSIGLVYVLVVEVGRD